MLRPKPARAFVFRCPSTRSGLLAGVLSRWPWIAVGTIAFGALGILGGIRATHPSYTISLSLIKRRVPHTVQTSETGQTYRPVDLNDATLLANLRTTYTDANPLVQTKLQSPEYLGGQIQKLAETGETDLDAYTGTPLGHHSARESFAHNIIHVVIFFVCVSTRSTCRWK